MAHKGIATVAVLASTINVPPPAEGISNGDILILGAVSDNTGTTIVFPAGFTALTGSPLTIGNDGGRFAAAWKQASGESGSYAIVGDTGSHQLIGFLEVLSGEDAVAFLHQQSNAQSNSANASPWSVTSAAFPSATTETCDLILICHSDTADTNVAYAAPAGFTERADVTTGVRNFGVFTRDAVAAGETGVYTAIGTGTPSGSGWGVFAIALKNAAGGGGGGDTAAVTGTLASGADSADVRAGTGTIILTLTGDTYVTFDNTIRQAIIDGIVAGSTLSAGWNAKRSGIPVANVVRTSATICTITVSGMSGFVIPTSQILTITLPASALTGGIAIVATETITITPTTGEETLGGGGGGTTNTLGSPFIRS